MGWGQYSCSGCDSCESCDTCQKCVECETCDKCTSDCEVAQYVVSGTDLKACKVLGEFLSSDFRFSPDPSDPNTVMGPNAGQFNKASWDAIITYYNQGTGIGKVGALLRKNIAYSTKDAVSPFTAAEYNRVAGELGGIYTVFPDRLIYGYYFTELERAVNNYQVSTDACDYCNAKCDCESGVSTNCVACQACDKCQTCDSCQRCDSQTGCHDSCCGCNNCDTCQGCNNCNTCQTGNEEPKPVTPTS